MHTTIAQRYFPALAGNRVYQILLVIAGVILLALSAKLQVPFWPVPMTMQTFVVLMIGATLGAVISRTALSQESVPAPPAGVEVVKFRTSFANKADVIETVSLAREGSDWKVVGIYLD